MKRVLPYLLLFLAINAEASGFNKKNVLPAKSADNTVLACDAGFPGGLKWTAGGSGSGSVSPLTTKGDVYTFTSADARLGVGTNGQVLSADSAATAGIKWANPTSLTTKGDLQTFSATDNARLAVGSAAQILSTDSSTATGLKWVNAVSVNPSASKGDLDTFGATNMALAVGTNGQVLSSDSSTATGLKWVNSSGISPLTTKGDIHTYASDNTRLPVGANATVLSADSSQATGLNWVTANTINPAKSKGDLDTFGTTNMALAVGSNAQVLSADSSTATGLKWVASNSINPSDTKGDIDTFASTNTKLLVGTNGQILSADSSTPTGLKWVNSNAISPAKAKGDLDTFGSTNQALAVGTNGQILSADSSTATGLKWTGVAQHKTFINFPVHSCKLSADTACRIDGGLYFWRLLYADGVNDTAGFKNIALWQGRVDDNWQGGPLFAKINYYMVSSDSTAPAGGQISFGVSIMATTSGDNVSVLNESFATENVITQTAPATKSADQNVIIPLTNNDSLTAGDWFIVRLRRAGNDSITGDAAVVSFAITE